MKSFAIYDEELQRKTPIGYLFYYEKAKSFIIELCDDLDEWDAPLLFQGMVRKGIYTILQEASLMWVRERVIPSGRQNIGVILKNHRLMEYDEMELLRISKGRCSQDSCYLVELRNEEFPDSLKKRMKQNILDCFITGDEQLVCMFRDDSVRKTDLSKLLFKYKDISHILKNKKLLDSARVGVGGYSVCFNESIEIPAYALRKTGELLPLKVDDFYSFISKNVIGTSKVCEMLQCSRQNLSYLVKEGKIEPVINGTKENMYMKGDVERIISDGR